MWGRGKDHRLGLLMMAPMAHDVMEPTVLPSSGIDRWYGALSARARVAQVSCGGSHTALVMRDGGLFTVGHGLYGQLGLGPRIRRTNGLMRVCGVVVPEHSGRAEAGAGPGAPTPTTAAAAAAAPSTTTRVAAPATAVSMPPVRAVTCGRYHCLACTPDGHVYAWGGGKNGRLGTGVELRSFLPWPIDRVYEPVPGQPMNVRRSRNIPTECRVAAVECGYHHSLVLSTDGALFSCGWGAHGQLGHGVQQDEPSLLRVTFYDAAGRPDPSVKVARVAGGDRHTLALTTDGRVFGFGSNEFGQLGLSGMPPPPPPSSPAELAHGPPPYAARVGNAYPKPVQLQGGALAGRRIVYVACGERHSVALSDQGEVICWGHGASGQLGLGAGVTAAATPQLMQAPTLRGSRVVHVCCGHESTLFMTADKRLFVTGSGEYGLLGVGPQAPRVSFEPLQARLPPQVVIDGVAMGHFHASLWGVRPRERDAPDPVPRYTALGRVGGGGGSSSSNSG